MKTRLLIIIGIIAVIAISITSISFAYNQEIKLIMGMQTDDTSSVDKLELPDPICFVIDRSTSGESGSGVTMDTCITLEKFEEIGCTKPMLEHLLRYSNLLDEELDGLWSLNEVGLPDGMPSEDFDECVDAIVEKRPILNSKSQDGVKTCPDGQDYNVVLFKCVISCDEDLVYNGHTESCSTEFELKYHGFCNEGFVYSPTLHECHSDNSVSHVPLKDPPRTLPPEPTPTHESKIMKKAEELGITNIMKAVDSQELSYDEKKDYIKIRYEESPNKIPSLNIRIKDFTRNLEYGERPTFTVIETGYAIPCTHPTLEVYYLKQETGNEYTPDDLVYKDRIMYSCPFFDSFYPVLKFWDETDFEPFPVCEREGRYLVVGDSGYERMPLEEYYCGIENED